MFCCNIFLGWRGVGCLTSDDWRLTREESQNQNSFLNRAGGGEIWGLDSCLVFPFSHFNYPFLIYVFINYVVNWYRKKYVFNSYSNKTMLFCLSGINPNYKLFFVWSPHNQSLVQSVFLTAKNLQMLILLKKCIVWVF